MKNNILLFVIVLLSFASNAQKIKEVSQDWASFSQFLEIKVDDNKKFKVVGSVKVETDDENGWAGIWARVDNDGEEMGFFDNMGDRPIKSNIWQPYVVEGVLTKEANRLNFGGICISNGKFFFDKFELFIENENGELESVAIDNPSFENKAANDFIPQWSQGISKGSIIKVKEFDVSSTTDASDGNHAILFIGSGIKPSISSIGNIEGASPQIGAMISMLEDLKSRVENQVKNMSKYEIDHLHDEKANRIGALIMHLAAAEKFYQVFTFEGRGFNEEEKEIWDDALDLGQKARDKYKGHNVQYYLDIYNSVRATTIEELKKRDDSWFEEMQPSYGVSNHYCWFHVMEHQSSHLGQILFLSKRIPPEQVINLPNQIKD